MTTIECPICLDDFDDQSKTAQLLIGCGHSLCLQCVRGIRAKTCPVCRKPFADYVRNFAISGTAPQHNKSSEDADLARAIQESLRMPQQRTTVQREPWQTNNSGSRWSDSVERTSAASPENESSYVWKPCTTWSKTGRCDYGSRCIFQHGLNDTRREPVGLATRQKFAQSSQPFGASPSQGPDRYPSSAERNNNNVYSNNNQDQQQPHQPRQEEKFNWKYECEDFKRGFCKFGDRCYSRHGLNDRRDAPVGFERSPRSAINDPLHNNNYYYYNYNERFNNNNSGAPCNFFAQSTSHNGDRSNVGRSGRHQASSVRPPSPPPSSEPALSADLVLYSAQMIEQNASLNIALTSQLPAELTEYARSALEKCRSFLNDEQRRESAKASRFLIERLVDALSLKVGGRAAPRAELSERINGLMNLPIQVPRHIVAAFHRVREIGNSGTHQVSVSLENVSELVRNLGTILPWVVQVLRA